MQYVDSTEGDCGGVRGNEENRVLIGYDGGR